MFSDRENSIALISLPWAPIHSPSLALGQLKPVLGLNGIHCENFYCSNKFYDIISNIYHCKKDQIIYDISYTTDTLLADWFFSRYAFGIDSHDYLTKHAHYLTQHIPNQDWVSLRDLFEEQLEEIAHYDWSQFRYIGLSCTFNQIVSSLALSRRIKELHPDVIIVLGGDRIDADIGHEFVQKIKWVDWVIVGEGERSLVAAIKDHQSKNFPLKIPGLITSEGSESTMPLTADEFDALPTPDFDEFYAENPSKRGSWELSRGCWYGDKTLCSFCGMVPEGKYKIRSNPIKTLRDLKNKYNIEHMEFVDLLTPTSAIEDVFSQSRNLGMEFSLTTRVDMVRHDEIHQLQILADGGVKDIYVGIESLHPRLLKMMRKGQLAVHCISFLKWAAYYGIQADWKILFGIPFEKAEYYTEMLDVLKKIPHLHPPQAQPIMVTKKSPYYKELRPLKVPKVYNYIYPDFLSLEKIAHDFEFANIEHICNKTKNISAIKNMLSYIQYWNNSGSSSSLTMNQNLVTDHRNEQKREIKINDEQIDILIFCSIPRKSHQVAARFSSDYVQELCCQDLLLELDNRLITLIEPQSPVLERYEDSESLAVNELIQLTV